MHTLLVAIIVLVVAVAGYLFWQNQSAPAAPAEYSQETVNADLDAAMPADLSEDFKEVDADISTL